MKLGHSCQKHPTGTFNKSVFPYVFLCVFRSYSEPKTRSLLNFCYTQGFLYMLGVSLPFSCCGSSG